MHNFWIVVIALWPVWLVWALMGLGVWLYIYANRSADHPDNHSGGA